MPHFVEVPPIQDHTGTLVPAQTQTRHNYHRWESTVTDSPVPVRLSVPATLQSGPTCDVTGLAESATEGRQPLPRLIGDPHTAEAVALHALHLTDGEQRVGDVLVIGEHGVVHPAHPATVPQTKTVADVLRHAALIIEERGWHHGALMDVATGRVCLLGGVAIAAGMPKEVLEQNTGRGYTGPVYDFLEQHLRTSPWAFNDDAESAEEVTTALRAAADAWEADR